MHRAQSSRRKAGSREGNIGVEKISPSAHFGGMSLVELEQEIQKLSPAELGALTRWLDDYAAARWDHQIEQDVAAGRLDKVLAQADADFAAGKCQAL